MSENFPGNPWADVHSEVKPDAAGIMSALNLLAYEQRTATLVNLYAAQIQANRPVPPELRQQVNERLGYPLDPENRGKVWGWE